MPVHADVVIVEHVRGDAVHQRGIPGREIAAAGDFRRAVVAGVGGHDLRDELDRLLVRARDHRADAIEHADARAERGPRGHSARIDRGHEFREVGGQRGHGCSLVFLGLSDGIVRHCEP
jgi:hypothetical protein